MLELIDDTRSLVDAWEREQDELWEEIQDLLASARQDIKEAKEELL